MPSSMSAGQSSLLVLTNHVYAKKEDGLFYPGSIEGKLENNYVVVFADNTKEMLPEEYITWLAFCGLPPSSWPKNPIIQPTISTDKEFAVDGSFIKYVDDTSGQKPASLTVLKDEDIDNCASESKWSFQPSTRKCYRPRKRQFRLNSDDPTEEDVHDLKLMRSSVLRINAKALSKGNDRESNVDTVGPAAFPSEDKTRDLLTTSSFQPTPKCLKNKRANFRGMLSPRTGNDKVFEMTRCSCGSLGMPKFETKYCRCANEEEELDAENMEYYGRPSYLSPYPHRPYQNMDWYEASHFNQSSPTSPITPSNLSSPIEHDPQQSMRTFWSAPRHVREGLGARFELPLFGHDPYGIHMVREEWKENTTGVGPGKKRRKDGLKKCRKVYGVYNRNLWCTQCKWKKACTRFRA